MLHVYGVLAQKVLLLGLINLINTIEDRFLLHLTRPNCVVALAGGTFVVDRHFANIDMPLLWQANRLLNA